MANAVRLRCLPDELRSGLREAEKEIGIDVEEQVRVAVRLWNTLPAVTKRGYQNLLGDDQPFLNTVVPGLDDLLDWLHRQVWLARKKSACEEQLIAIHRTAALILDRVSAYRNVMGEDGGPVDENRIPPGPRNNGSEIDQAFLRASGVRRRAKQSHRAADNATQIRREVRR